MTDIVLRLAIVLLLVAWPLSGSLAGPKENYELQERCGKRADELFKREYGNGISNTKDGQAVTGQHLTTAMAMYREMNMRFWLEKQGAARRARPA